MRQTIYHKLLLVVLSLTAVCSTAGADTFVEYGCLGNITIYKDEELTFTTPDAWPYQAMCDIWDGGWSLCQTNGISYLWNDKETLGVKILSKDYWSCKILGVEDNTRFAEYGVQIQLHCKAKRKTELYGIYIYIYMLLEYNC